MFPPAVCAATKPTWASERIPALFAYGKTPACTTCTSCGRCRRWAQLVKFEPGCPQPRPGVRMEARCAIYDPVHHDRHDGSPKRIAPLVHAVWPGSVRAREDEASLFVSAVSLIYAFNPPVSVLGPPEHRKPSTQCNVSPIGCSRCAHVHVLPVCNKMQHPPLARREMIPLGIGVATGRGSCWTPLRIGRSVRWARIDDTTHSLPLWLTNVLIRVLWCVCVCPRDLAVPAERDCVSFF